MRRGIGGSDCAWQGPKNAIRGHAEAYCPHCFLLVEQDVQGHWPVDAMRCPHCRLLIGPGRGRPTAEANPGARGSAAGVFAHQAKREDGDDVSHDEVRARSAGSRTSSARARSAC